MVEEKNQISQTTYDTETLICKQASSENNGCNWGECDKCGVVPLLVKLRTGSIIEEKDAVAKLKQDVLKS